MSTPFSCWAVSFLLFVDIWIRNYLSDGLAQDPGFDDHSLAVACFSHGPGEGAHVELLQTYTDA